MMATPSLSASAHLHISSQLALRGLRHGPDSNFLPNLKGSSLIMRRHSFPLSLSSNSMLENTWPNISCVVNKASRQSGEPEKINMDYLIDKAKKVWDRAPQPVKSFPWIDALDSFVRLMLDLILTVVKFLCIPLLATTSLSELSYCAHERKLFLTPYPVLIGMAVAGVLKETALELSPVLKDAEVPWHLIAVAIFFTLLKLLGPYYPYWGRIFIPHIANGALWRTLWSTYSWYRSPRKGLRTRWQNSANDNHSEPDHL